MVNKCRPLQSKVSGSTDFHGGNWLQALVGDGRRLEE